eukprot:248821_1
MGSDKNGIYCCLYIPCGAYHSCALQWIFQSARIMRLSNPSTINLSRSCQVVKESEAIKERIFVHYGNPSTQSDYDDLYTVLDTTHDHCKTRSHPGTLRDRMVCISMSKNSRKFQMDLN